MRLARFRREAEAVAALNHPNIVTIYSVEDADGVHFLTMEFVDGKPLQKLIPGSGIDLRQFFDIAIPLADALASAHAKGITHRDLKPPNVMISSEGRGDDARLRPSQVRRAGRVRRRRISDASTDTRWSGRGHGALHVAGAARGERGRSPYRYFFIGYPSLRVGSRPEALRGRYQPLAHLGHPQGHAATGDRDQNGLTTRAESYSRALPREGSESSLCARQASARRA